MRLVEVSILFFNEESAKREEEYKNYYIGVAKHSGHQPEGEQEGPDPEEWQTDNGQDQQRYRLNRGKWRCPTVSVRVPPPGVH